jgi:hypothetical protein
MYRTSEFNTNSADPSNTEKRNMTRKLGSELKIGNARGVLAHLAIGTRYEKKKNLNKKVPGSNFQFGLNAIFVCSVSLWTEMAT